MKAAVLTLLLAPASAGAFELAQPIDCALGETCFIQQYTDRDPGPGALDFTCGSLAYDGHKGTDFAVPDDAAMQAGITVRAAAAGMVKGVRDGLPDIRVTDPAAPAMNGRDCGNGVVIDHGDGWETQYCHMRQGSISVRGGDRVAEGDRLGLVGLSGNTEFPHLHLSVRHDGAVVDPFAAADATRCGGAEPDLWRDDIAYQPGGFVAAGFANTVPDYAAINSGTVPSPGAQAPALVFWANLYGTRAGDKLHLVLTGPEGEIAAQDVGLDRTQARAMRAIGRKLRGAGWPAGNYDGIATLQRDGRQIARISARLTLP